MKENMQTVLAYLKECGAYFIATTEGTQPRVRPFGAAEIIDGRLYIMTGKVKDFFKQVSANSEFEICAMKASGAEWMRLVGGDVTAVQCLMYTGILESCIQCGLIQTNSGYRALFEAGSIGAQIADTDGHIRYASSNAPKLTEEMIRLAEKGAVMPDRRTLIRSSRIDGGYVLWQEDISDITALLEKLEEN